MSEMRVQTVSKQLSQLQLIPPGDEMPYDFKHPRRHEYFECFVFRQGGGVH